MNLTHGMLAKVWVNTNYYIIFQMLGMSVVTEFDGVDLESYFRFADVKKKLLAAGIKACNRPLQPWIKAINNHLYWSCEMSAGDPEVNRVL